MGRDDSDMDYYDWLHGPRAETVTRECSRCHRTFEMVVQGEYEMHPYCDSCYREALRAQERKAEALTPTLMDRR